MEPALRFPALAQVRTNLSLKAVNRKIKLGADFPESPIAALETTNQSASLRLKQNQNLDVSLSSELSGLTALNWLGFDGINVLEPLITQKPLDPGNTATVALPLHQAGTFLLAPWSVGKSPQQPAKALALVVDDASPPATDRDEVLLIQDWRLMPDGRALGPGGEAKDATTVYTANAKPSFDIELRPNQRLRLRIVNGCQRAPLGLKIANLEMRVIAIDSQPAEPFVARDGQLVMAPGSRTDVMIDAAQPGKVGDITLFDGKAPRRIGQIKIAGDAARHAPLSPTPALSSAHLPAQLDLKNAARVELQLDGKTPWIAPEEFSASAKPAFEIKRGRAAVVALTNKDVTPMVFRLHGHHFRLLDRLDDGWKPFWLDTLLLTPGQTQRIAFLAENPGQWLIEAAGIDWAAPKLLRHYAVT